MAIDRIADPWGERTPYGRGERWPVREDGFLEQGVAPEDVDRWVPSASILHSNGDGLDIAVKAGRIVGVRGYLGLLHRAECALAETFTEVGDAHAEEPDVQQICRKLAGWCTRHAERLAPFAERYG